MDSEKTEKKPGIFGKIGALWKSGTKGKVICIVGVLVILGIIGAFTDDEEGGGGGGGGYVKISDQSFVDIFGEFPKNEGVVYAHNGIGLYVLQATKKGNLVEYRSNYLQINQVVWVETKRRYEDDEPLDKGYYIRRGSMEYQTAMGAEKTVARYVEVTGSLLEKVKKQVVEEKAAAEAKAKAEAEAEAKAKAEREAAIAKAKAEREAAIAKAKAEIAAMQPGKTAGETKAITLLGGAAMEMVWCPPGTFMMGTRPPHQVTLTKGFWMAKTEVTQRQWKSVMGTNPSDFKGNDLPVEKVSWNDCLEFCKVTGLQLPTEAQWEYACRAGSTGGYAGTGNLDDMGWYMRNSESKTHPVGQKQPNAWGLYDMHGNVFEWCADWHRDYPHGAGAVTDPQGPSSGSQRVYRGGGWGSSADYCASSSRDSSPPSNDYCYHNSLGFRLVRTLSE